MISGQPTWARAFLRMRQGLRCRLRSSRGSDMPRRSNALHLLRTSDQMHVPSIWSTSEREERSSGTAQRAR